MTPDPEHLEIVVHLSVALVAGGAIGLERSYHGRAAGFRTHALVCISSSALMLVTLYQARWFPVTDFDTVRVDPTRMAQGIMTGIGFLGAGAILKEGLSVRGLTTAASIWITAAIGILVGIGFYFPAAVATLLTLGTLSVFRWIEMRMPTQLYAHHVIRFARESAMPEAQMRTLIAAHGFTIANLSYQLCDHGRLFEYSMVIRTLNKNNAGRLSEALCAQPTVLEFRIAPTGD
ncbi:MAG: MgtC/SapB family protein [Pseudomonadota bacterium]|nr:MgtC/SapB family protein [Burkholderiales bacterium]MDQ3196770.1 MgtC/SapB family protein [Pseudomonadota bacterium]